jgi:hypothetical protein
VERLDKGGQGPTTGCCAIEEEEEETETKFYGDEDGQKHWSKVITFKSCKNDVSCARFSKYVHIYIYICLGVFPLLASWNDFAGTPMEGPMTACYDSCLKGYTRRNLLQRTYTSVKLSNGVRISGRLD